jgi:hypothetical protein
LLQIGVLLLSLAAVLSPLMEFFDRWDTSGVPINDTELGIFGCVLVFALILLVGKLTAALDKLVPTGTVFRPRLSPSIAAEIGVEVMFAIVPHNSPPLKI